MIRVRILELDNIKHTSQHRAGVFALAEIIPQSCLLAYDNRGKPFVASGNVSIAHTESVAVATYSPDSVGVDVELSARTITRPVRRYLLTNKEQEILNRPVLYAWVIKEAVLKLVGDGITKPPRELVTIQVRSGDFFMCRLHTGREIWVQTFERGAYIIAIAYENYDSKVELY